VALGLVGLYARRSKNLGILGLIGFVLAFLGLELTRGYYLATLFADLGFALFGVASLRDRTYPRTLTMLLVISAMLGEAFNPTVIVRSTAELGYVGAAAAVILNAIIAWLGFVLLAGRSEGEPRPPVREFALNLIRLAGGAAALGGVLVILFDFWQIVSLSYPDPGKFFGELSNDVITSFYTQQLLRRLALLGSALVALGLVGLYVRLSGGAVKLQTMEIIRLVSFMVAFGGTFFALDVEDVNWGALLAVDLGWALFGMSALREPGVYPRVATVLLIMSVLTRSAFNLLVISLVVGEDDASTFLYEGPGAYSIVYARIGADIIFNAAVVWLGFVLLWREHAWTERWARVLDTRTAYRFSPFEHNRLLWTAVLVAGLIPIALVGGLLPGEQRLGLNEAQATTINPVCPSMDQTTYGAYESPRLVVHNPCQHMVGTVHEVDSGEKDGDLEILVTVNPEYASLRGSPQNIDNLRRFGYGDDLMMELMPRDGKVVDPDTGVTRSPTSPRPGSDRVDARVAWVFDSQRLLRAAPYLLYVCLF
jgi:hypothetical protein